MIDWLLKGVCHDDVMFLNSMQAAARIIYTSVILGIVHLPLIKFYCVIDLLQSKSLESEFSAFIVSKLFCMMVYHFIFPIIYKYDIVVSNCL